MYAGGIHALQSNLAIDIKDKKRYHISLTAKTYGLLGKMAPWEGTFETYGWQDDVFHPELHQSIATWRKEDDIKKYSYHKNGSFKSFSLKDGGHDGSIQKVPSELTEGTSDALTATLNTMRGIATTGKCEGSTDVFDGKRRFKLVFQEKKKVQLEASRWNVYSGPAIECSVEVKPVAGAWHKKPRGWMSIQEQGQKRGTMPTVWFAQVVPGQPAVPVKVRVKTAYGTLFMHMTSFQSSDKKMALDK